MPIETLQQLGLSINEAKIYEALLELKTAGVGEISSKAEVHRRNVYDTLSRLIEKGLVFPVLSKGENLYSPAEPDKLLSIVEKEKEVLVNVLPQLKAKYHKRDKAQEAYIYRGVEGFKNYMRDILKTGEDVYFVGGKLIWLDDQLKTFSSQFFKEAKKQGIKFYGVFDTEVREKGQDFLKNFPKPYKFLPPEHSTNSALIIFGDYVVTYTGLKLKKMNQDITIFVLRDKQLAESYRTWSKFIYDHCPKQTKPLKTEKQKVTTYTGKAEFRKAHFEAVKQMKDNNELYVMIASGEKWYGSMGTEALKKFDKIRKDKNIIEKVVALETQRKGEQKGSKKRALVEMKFLPDEFDNMSDTVVYDNITLITFHGDPVFAVMIKNKQIAESYKKYFDILWKIAKK